MHAAIPEVQQVKKNDLWGTHSGQKFVNNSFFIRDTPKSRFDFEKIKVVGEFLPLLSICLAKEHRKGLFMIFSSCIWNGLLLSVLITKRQLEICRLSIVMGHGLVSSLAYRKCTSIPHAPVSPKHHQGTSAHYAKRCCWSTKKNVESFGGASQGNFGPLCISNVASCMLDGGI